MPAALKLATTEKLTAAFLDVCLSRDTTEAVADNLAARGIPFDFYSGQDLPDDLKAKHPEAKLLVKPSRPDSFVDELLRAINRASAARPERLWTVSLVSTRFVGAQTDHRRDPNRRASFIGDDLYAR